MGNDPSQNTYRTGDLISSGKLAIGDGYRAKNSELAEHGLPFARAGNIDGGFHFEGADRFPEEHLDKVGDKASRPGDVVFTSKGTVGRFAFVRENTPRFVFSPQLSYWRSLDEDLIDSRYLFYWIQGSEFWLQAAGVKGQTDMADYVSLTDQRRMSITLPDVSRQRAIAHILGTLDDKIDLNRRLNETLEGMARALFKAWFVDFDPVRAKMEGCWQAGESLPGLPAELYDLFPDRLVESELGEVPDGWEVRPIGELVTLSRDSVTPSDHPDEIFDHFSIPAYDEGATPKAESGSEIKSNKYVVSEGSVLVSKLNPRIPRVWLPVVGADRRPICSTEFLVAQPREANHRSWIYCLLVSSEFQMRFGSLVTGTSGSHQRVRPDAFLSLRVPVPPGAVRLRFAVTAGSIHERIAQARGEAQVLASLRDTLLPRLISGELRIEDTERILERRGA